MSRSALPGFLLALAILLAGLLLALTLGRYPVSLAQVFEVLAARLTGRASGAPLAVQDVVLLVRGPRIVAAVLVGAALAVSGTAFQGLFRNPLVSPDILGASSGAALGAVLGIYFSLGVAGIELLAFAGGMAAVAAVYAIGSAVRDARSDPRPGADRRRHRRTARFRCRLDQISGRSVQSAAGDDVLAARQPRGDQCRRSRAAVRPGRGRYAVAAGAALAHERRCRFRTEEARALGVPTRRAAGRHHRRGNAGHLGERRDRRHHRLGRSRRPASGAVAGRSRFRPPDPDRGRARRRLSALHRHACPHRGAGGNPARNSHRLCRHAVFHLACWQACIGPGHEARRPQAHDRLSRPLGRARARRCAFDRRSAGAAWSERQRQDHAA